MTKEWEAEFYRLVTALADANFECGAWAEGDGSYEHLTDKQAEARKALCEFVLSSRPEARAIEPWMLDRVIDHLTMSGWFLGDYQNMSVKEVLTKWKDSLPPQNTHEEG